MPLLAAVAVVLALLCAGVLVANALVRRRNRVRYAWSDVDVLLERRARVLPALAAAVTGSMRHEAGVLEQVAQARTRALAVAGRPPDERAAGEAELGEAAARLIAVIEASPELHADETSDRLYSELVETEAAIARSRLVYNRTVESYNTARTQVPGALVAAPLGFRAAPFFGRQGAA